MAKVSPLIVIVGPTASGKSSLAIELARRYDGEIICADSRTIYKGLDIGTAKPTSAEMAEIPHHLIDVVLPNQHFSAAEFKRQALIWIDDITIRGKLPVMVGGTGLYVDGVIFDFAFLPPASHDEREKLESLSIGELQALVSARGLAMPENSKNKRHLVRALETNGEVAVKKGLRSNTLVIGMDLSKAEVDKRIDDRVLAMFSGGFIGEAVAAAEQYGWDAPGLQAPGYKAARLFTESTATEQEAMAEFSKHDRQLAKRQRTWFKRNPHINWVQTSGEAEKIVKNFLQKQ